MRHTRILLVQGMLLLSLLSCHAPAQEVAPLHKSCSNVEKDIPTTKYSVALQNRDTLGAIVLQVATSPRDSEGTAVIRLACQLADEFPREPVIHALIFDDKIAARNSAPGAQDQKNYGATIWHLRAHYELDRNRNIEYIEYVVPTYRDDLLQLFRQKVILSH